MPYLHFNSNTPSQVPVLSSIPTIQIDPWFQLKALRERAEEQQASMSSSGEREAAVILAEIVE
jgi:hypothetical protein